MSVTDEQRAQLLRPINRVRVKSKDGKGHLEGYDVRAMLTRIFDFAGWSDECTDLVLLYARERQLKNGKPGIEVAYRATVRLTVPGAIYTESAAYSSVMPDYLEADAHDMAIKSAQTQALKRCAVNLGDQFGISLYNGGSLAPLIRRVIGHGEPEQKDGEQQQDEGLDSHITEPLADEDAPAEQPEYDTSEPDEPAPPQADLGGQTPGEPRPGVDGSPPEVWRDLILSDPPPKARPQVHYLRLLQNMTKAGVQNALVEVDGKQITLRALLDQRIAASKRSA